MIYHLGTSGWSYPHWRPKFYPPGLASGNWLEFYSRHFTTVEVNMTFYRFPKPETLRSWMDKTPQGFTFTLKANRQITHTKKLHKVAAEVRYFDILADALKDKLACILYQLPPSIKADPDLLAEFLATLSPDYKNVIEFRHESWYTDQTEDLLRRSGVGFCTVSSAKVPRTPAETAEFAYFRFHGLTGGYRYRYSDEELAEWAATIKSLKTGRECFIYFNNDYQAYAIENCRKLAELLK